MTITASATISRGRWLRCSISRGGSCSSAILSNSSNVRSLGKVPGLPRPSSSTSTAWHERAMAAAEKADLGEFVSLCVKAKEWKRLAQRVHSATAEELESLSHYCTEPAANVLAKKDALAAAKLYRALALRIVNAG